MVRDSVGVKDKEAVLIVGDAPRIPLMEAIAVEVAKAGGFPHLVLDTPNAWRQIVAEVPLAYLGTPNSMALAELKNTDVIIGMSASEDPTLFAKIPEERVALVRKADQAWSKAFYTKPIRSVVLGNPAIPTAALASFYGVTLQSLENQFWDAVNTPSEAIAQHGRRVKESLASGQEVRIRTQAGTDLRLKLAGRKVFMNDGRIHETPTDRPAEVWLPAGEVYTAPESSSANGMVVVPLVDYRGIKIKDLKLTFVNGRVTKIEAAQNAEALQQALEQSSGDKDLFSFLDIGVNPNSRMVQGSDYCTFTMAGIVTIGIGAGAWAGSPNQSEFEAAFFIPNATLEVDGKTILKEGKIAI